MELSVVIPAFNEEKRLAAFLREAMPYLHKRFPLRFEVIVVDDGSTDATSEVARRVVGDAGRVLKLDENRGKGAAVRAGMLAARGAFRLFVDADGAIPMPELERLLARTRGGADVAIGSRNAGNGRRRWTRATSGPLAENSGAPEWHVSRTRHFTGRIFAFLVRALTRLPIRDTQCGFKLFRGDVAERIFSRQTIEGFAFDVEILVIAQRLGFSVEEVAVHWHDVDGTKVRVGRDSFRMIAEVFKTRHRHRHLLPEPAPDSKRRGIGG